MKQAREGHGAPEILLLGKKARELGNWDLAEKLYHKALEADPGNGFANYWLAMIAHRRGIRDEALRRIDIAVAAKPRNVGFLCKKGELNLAAGRNKQALLAYRKAADIEPGNVNTVLGLGNALRKANRFPEAQAQFERATVLTPSDPNAWLGLALSCQRQKHYEEAAKYHRKVLELAPGNTLAAFNLGRLLQGDGEFEAATVFLKQVIQAIPEHGGAHYELARCRKYRAGDPHIAEMERILTNPSLAPDQRRYLHYALAKVYDDIGSADAAMQHLNAASAIDPPAFDREEHTELVNRLVKAFSRELFSSRAASGDPTERLVFVVGMPRSGTTLVDQMLSSHPAVHAAGELIYFHHLANAVASRVNSGHPYPECVADLEPAQLKSMQGNYLNLFNRLPAEITRITNKFPENYLVLGLIALLFPGARIIHCRRDPMDICLSNYFQYFQRGQDYSFSLENLGFYYREYDRLMDHWRETIPNPFIEVVYEDLIADFANQSRRLVEFAGLEWNDRCLAFYDNRNTVGTASVWQVRQPVYTSSVARWKQYEKHLGPLKEALER